MRRAKVQMLRELEAQSWRRIGQFSRQLMTAEPDDKEEILAGIEVERALAQVCRQCLST